MHHSFITPSAANHTKPRLQDPDFLFSLDLSLQNTVCSANLAWLTSIALVSLVNDQASGEVSLVKRNCIVRLENRGLYIPSIVKLLEAEGL